MQGVIVNFYTVAEYPEKGGLTQDNPKRWRRMHSTEKAFRIKQIVSLKLKNFPFLLTSIPLRGII